MRHAGIVVLIVAFLAACTAPSGPPPTPTQGVSGEPACGVEATPCPPGQPAATPEPPAAATVTVEMQVPPGPGSAERPPELVLRSGAGEQAGRVGSYCWFGGGAASGAPGICADAIGILAPLAALTVPAGGPWTLVLGGERPASGTLRLYEWGEPASTNEAGGWVAHRPSDEGFVERVDLPAGAEWTVTPASPLPPGEYLGHVFLQWSQPGGDASYGFHLRVE